MQIQKFYDKCIRNFAECLEQFELCHFNPYYETNSSKMMAQVLGSLKGMGKKAEVLVDFGEYNGFDCFDEACFEDGLLYIKKKMHGDNEALALKPASMLIRQRFSNPSGNFVFIRNAGLQGKEYEKAGKASIILKEPDENVLIYPHGSLYSDSHASFSLMQFLGEKKENRKKN